MFLAQQEKLMLSILSNEKMTVRTLMECLMSEPYGLTRDEVLEALRGLNQHGLLEIKGFTINANSFDIDTQLTFAYDWIHKL